MKNYLFYLCFIFILFLANSCSKESDQPATNVVLPEHIGEAIGLFYGSSEENEDAEISITSNESLNSPNGKVFLTSGAIFNDQNGKRMMVGDLKILGVDIPFNSSETRYLNRELGTQLHEIGAYSAGDDALVELIAETEGSHYASFNQVTSTSRAFNAEATLQSDPRRIDKSTALRIKFDFDPNFKDTYFILAQNDKPMFIQVTQGNEFLIEESQLSFLEVGKRAIYYLARGEVECIMNNNSKVCIKKRLIATGGGLNVVDSDDN